MTLNSIIIYFYSAEKFINDARFIVINACDRQRSLKVTDDGANCQVTEKFGL